MAQKRTRRTQRDNKGTTDEASDGGVGSPKAKVGLRPLKAVVVAAGHAVPGDPGAIASDGTREADLNIVYKDAMVRMLQGELQIPRVIPVSDAYGLRETLKTIKELKGAYDLAIEVHVNSFSSESAHGAEVYLSDNAPRWLEDLSLRFLKGLELTLGRRNRGIKRQTSSARGSLAWCSELEGRGMLIELGFLSNPMELEWLKESATAARVADVLKQAIVRA